MAQKLVFYPINHSDSTVWYVKNNSSDTLYPTAVTLNWFHMLPTAMAFPIDFSSGFYNKTETLQTVSNKYKWKYKTTFGAGVSDTLFPKGSISVGKTVNYNTLISDTIMPANASIFFNKPVFAEVPAIPENTSCDFRRIFLTSRDKNQGIHYYSSVSPSLNPNVCQGLGTVAVASAFNLAGNQTVSRLIPKCKGGQYWTSFGFPKDSVLYYSFAASDGKHLDSLINGLDSGDYFAYVSYPAVSQFDLLNQSATWAKVGLDVSLINMGLTNQLCVLGRKGLPKGKAYHYCYAVKPAGSVVSVSVDYPMVKGQGFNELKPYPDCYENLAVVHKPYVPEIEVNNVQTFSQQIKLWPNPTANGFWTLSAPPGIKSCRLYSAQGKLLAEYSQFTAHNTVIGTPQLTPGIYYLQFFSAFGNFGRQLVVK
jgi:hypothetical protein